MGALRKLFEKGPANAEKSLLGCLVANVLGVAVLGAILWLLGAQLTLPWQH